VLKKVVARSIILFLNFIIIFTVVPAVTGQSPSDDPRLFRSGFSVSGEFLRFFDRYGGIETFGYPLTIEFEEGSRRVQYFHRGRMELIPENPPGQRVVLGPLGELLSTSEPPLDEPNPRPDRRFFSETGHIVASAFLHYFEARGGMELLGYPISEMMVENERIVQYFERARLDWHPENPPGLQVLLGTLGELYLDQNNFAPGVGVRDPSTDENYQSDRAPFDVTSLDIIASVSHPFAGQNQLQTLFVFVYDQDGNPLVGAEVEAEIHFPDRSHKIEMTQTNELGLSWGTFNVGQAPVGGTVIIDIKVRYNGVEGEIQTSFVVWL
jgi:hypothetical protein